MELELHRNQEISQLAQPDGSCIGARAARSSRNLPWVELGMVTEGPRVCRTCFLPLYLCQSDSHLSKRMGQCMCTVQYLHNELPSYYLLYCDSCLPGMFKLRTTGS